MQFHWMPCYASWRRKASPPSQAAGAPPPFDASACTTVVFRQAKAAAPEVFARDSAQKAHRISKIEELALWLAYAYAPLPPDNRRALLECCLDRIEIGLREATVGDVGVSRQMPEIAAALNGRLQRYVPLILARDTPSLIQAMAEHNIPPTRLNIKEVL